jgi:Arc/MetJ-type ribon-helix-helix transcriptional regulator
MKSLTIRLPDDLADRLERESQHRGVSKSDVVRERLSQDTPPPPLERGLMDILNASWAARPSARPARFRSEQKRRLADAIRAKKLPR